MSSIIDVRDATKIYDKKTVLDGLNLSIKRGEIIGLLGKNGAGKTTLIQSMLGFTRLNGGSINILGEDAAGLSGQAKEQIGYVPQNVVLYSSLKLYQLLNYTGSFFSNWDHDYADRLVAEWKLDKNEKIGAMSVGQRQKAAIIVAIAKHPELVILDEPVSSLDPAARKAFIDTLGDYARKGKPKTVIFATHIISDLEKIAHAVVVLDKGKVIFNDTIDQLKTQYTTPGETATIEDVVVKIYEQ